MICLIHYKSQKYTLEVKLHDFEIFVLHASLPDHKNRLSPHVLSSVKHSYVTTCSYFQHFLSAVQFVRLNLFTVIFVLYRKHALSYSLSVAVASYVVFVLLLL